MDKLNFYNDKIIRTEELDEIQDNIETADKNIMRDIVGAGIIEGYEINQINTTTLKVTSGVAYNQLQERLKTVQETTIVVDGLPQVDKRYMSVVVNFERQLSQPAVDGSGNSVFWRHDEGASLRVIYGQTSSQPALPALQAGDVLVCDCLLNTMQIEAIELDRVQRSPGRIKEQHEKAKAYADEQDVKLKADILSQLMNAVCPIGMVYTQLPNTMKPADLWPGTTWRRANENEMPPGAFARNEGKYKPDDLGNADRQAAAFVESGALDLSTGVGGQEDALQEHGHIYNYDLHSFVSGPGQYCDAIKLGNASRQSNRVNAVRDARAAKESRPLNVTVRYWIRES